MKVRVALNTDEKVNHCPLCSSPEIVKMASCKLSCCPACEFSFLDSRPAYEEILASYNAGSLFAKWQRQIEKRNPLWEKRLRLVLQYKQSGTLLDVGSGDGYFLEFASRHFAVESTEYSHTGVRYMEKRGFKPIKSDVLDIDAASHSKYDVITIWHVLEHLPDPAATLSKLHALLKPDGILVVAVPNELAALIRSDIVRRITRRRSNWPNLFWGDEVHLGYFTPTSLEKALNNFGFRVRENRVDDIYLSRNLFSLLIYYSNCLLNGLFSVQLDKAMVVVAEKQSS